MKSAVSQTKFDHLAAVIASVRRTCDNGSASPESEAELECALAELDTALQASREGKYRPSQRDAVASLELAVDLVRAGGGGDPDEQQLHSLIRVGLDRLKRMGL